MEKCELLPRFYRKGGPTPYFCNLFRKAGWCTGDPVYCMGFYNKVKEELKRMKIEITDNSYWGVFINKVRNAVYDGRAHEGKKKQEKDLGFIGDIVKRDEYGTY